MLDEKQKDLLSLLTYDFRDNNPYSTIDDIDRILTYVEEAEGIPWEEARYPACHKALVFKSPSIVIQKSAIIIWGEQADWQLYLYEKVLGSPEVLLNPDGTSYPEVKAAIEVAEEYTCVQFKDTKLCLIQNWDKFEVDFEKYYKEHGI